jgi:hypothetical protein
VKERAGGIFFRPFGADSPLTRLPTACAVGCILAPLRGHKSAFLDGESSDETSGPDCQLQREHDAPGSYVFASTTGRAVSPRSKGELNFSVHYLRRLDTSNG